MRTESAQVNLHCCQKFALRNHTGFDFIINSYYNKNMINALKAFVKKEKVLVIAAIAAAVSAFFVPPSAEYIGYLNFRVLFILFSLMTVVAGFKSCEVFTVCANFLCRKMKSLRSISLSLILCCFLSSMFITNDVALITFVPFTILILSNLKCEKEAAFIIVLETIAANLGSMLTPLGNPQNLFLYTQMNISVKDFTLILLPYTFLSLVLLVIFTFAIKAVKTDGFTAEKSDSASEIKNIKLKLFIYSVLFVLCILCVLRIIPAGLLTAIIVLCVFFADRKLLLQVDYMLLLTFCAFFIFSGNIGKIEFIDNFLHFVVDGNEFITSLISSQIISNVPSAVLLEPFCMDKKALLLGVNIGGLGTLVASLASLISYKLYNKSEIARTSRKNYMLIFTVMNLIFLAALTVLFAFLNRI